MHALNKIILPSLGMSPSKPLCERTARRWLVKLGWTRTILRKGVYMDGHERSDVVEYREKVFLPKMKEFERRMARYEGPDLKCVKPVLLAGEKEIIAEFQDETCCQGNDHQSSAWYVSVLAPFVISHGFHIQVARGATDSSEKGPQSLDPCL